MGEPLGVPAGGSRGLAARRAPRARPARRADARGTPLLTRRSRQRLARRHRRSGERLPRALRVFNRGTSRALIVQFEPAHAEGFRALVADTLPEFGFEVDPALDGDLDDPAATYAALWIAEQD